MGGTSELQAAVRAYFDAALASHGLFRSDRRDYYRWPITDGFEGWFHPGLTSRRTWIDALPYVGIRSEAVETMARRLGGAGFRRGGGGTFSRPLNSVITEPGVSVSLRAFSASEPIGPYADWIIDAFVRWGRPWAEEHSSLESLSPAGVDIAIRPGAPFVDVRRLAVMVLCGDAPGARDYLAKIQEEAREWRFDPGGKHAAVVAAWASRLEALL